MRNKRSAKINIGIELYPQVTKVWDYDDVITFLKNYQFSGKKLIYCDPPYLRQTRKKYYPLYKYEYTEEQHIELLQIIKTLPWKVMISG